MRVWELIQCLERYNENMWVNIKDFEGIRPVINVDIEKDGVTKQYEVVIIGA